MTVHHRGELRLALDHAILRVNRVPLTLRGPPESKPVFNRSDMHDHDRPGVFLQLQGRLISRFRGRNFGWERTSGQRRSVSGRVLHHNWGLPGLPHKYVTQERWFVEGGRRGGRGQAPLL
jgi:hypothetical protein